MTVENVRVLRVDVDGTLAIHHVANGDLRAWQDLVGGWIELIHGPGWCGYVNETGLLDGQRANPTASVLVRDAGALGYGVLVGPVLLFGPPDEDGNATDVPEHLLTHAIGVAGGAIPEERT